MAKLDPPEGGTFSDGLEVRVAFGTVWKQSLSELSGGQRSLLALSLILALLLFKPAPLYILDEVCLHVIFHLNCSPVTTIMFNLFQSCMPHVLGLCT
jgi:ABC-type transport system involved in cytochrome c biogenesis ATPase subunit